MQSETQLGWLQSVVGHPLPRWHAAAGHHSNDHMSGSQLCDCELAAACSSASGCLWKGASAAAECAQEHTGCKQAHLRQWPGWQGTSTGHWPLRSRLPWLCLGSQACLACQVCLQGGLFVSSTSG